MNTEPIKEEPRTITLKNATTINFTSREIDVIACILGGRAPKKIASFLSIAPRTVEIHIRNIMLKIGCNSRESIIDFIEKSTKLEEFKKHYFFLLVNLAFTKELKKISVPAKEKNINCLFFYYKEQRIKRGLINDLEDHFNLIGIKVTSKIWEKNKTNNFINNNNEQYPPTHIIYVVDDEFIERLQGIENKLIEEARNLMQEFHGMVSSITFLSINNDKTKNFYESLTSYTRINLLSSENYYFLFFELLKNLLPLHNIDKYFIEFKKQYELFDSASLLKNSIKSNELQKISETTTANYLTKRFNLKWLIFLISPICFSFVVLKINKKIEFLHNKSQRIESSITNQSFKENTQIKTVIFNLPLRNTNFTGRKQALIQIEEQLNQQKLGVITQAISGLGGIGKTQLALEFAYQSAEKGVYTAVFWISAETANTIYNAYQEIARHLNLDVKGLGSDKLQTLVHNKLASIYKNSKILFVLDNVPDYDYINNYLIKTHKELSPYLSTHILITSRSQHWSETSLLLDIFTQEEALMFVKKYLPNEQENSIIRLIKALHYFPLALNQATAYIKKHTNIDDYLKLYSNRQKDYLNKFPGDKNRYTESLWKTWDIALTKLSASAKKILFIASYLYPDDIPIEFFDNLTTEERGDAIEDLRKHSFITIINNKSFKIHRLLQEVIRISIAFNTKNNIFQQESQELNDAINLLKNKFEFSYAKHDKWSLCGKYLTHAQALAEHSIKAQGKFFISGIQLYSQVAMYLTYAQQDNKNAKEVWEKIITLIKTHYTEDKTCAFVLANIKTHLGLVMRQLSNIKQAKEYLEQSTLAYEDKISTISQNSEKLLAYLRWDENLTGSDGINFDHSFALFNLGELKQELGDFNAAKMTYKKAIELFNKCNIKNNVMIYKISLFQSLGNLYRYNGNVNDAMDLLESVKSIADKYFPNHMEQTYIYEHIADLLYYIGKFNEAKKIAEKCLKLRLAMFSKNHYRIGYIKFKLGLILCANNHIDEGIDYLKQAELIYNKNFEKEHVRYLYLYIHMHHAFEKHKEYNNSLQYLINAHKLAINHWGEKACSVLLNQFTPIEKFPTLGPLEKNVTYYMKSLDLTKKIFGEKHIRVARYHYLLGQIFENFFDKEKAKWHYQEALRIVNNQHFHDKILMMDNQKNIEIIQKRLNKR
jgi:DNA-binding CsgD family transcriptional regulator